MRLNYRYRYGIRDPGLAITILPPQAADNLKPVTVSLLPIHSWAPTHCTISTFAKNFYWQW